MTPTRTGRPSGRRGPSHASLPGGTARWPSGTIGTYTKERNVAERYFARVKQYRRTATRYDKKATNYLGFVWVASLAVMLA